MKKVTFLIVLAFILSLVHSIPQDNIVIGIYTQKYFYGDHMPIDGAILTYLYPTYVNLAAMTGAQVVPIYSYSSKDEILAQLAKVNSVIFPGGQQYININTTWTANALIVLQYAMQQNNAGRVFPVLGICQGLELMLYLTSDMRVDFLDRIHDQNGVWNTMQFVGKNYYLIDGVSDQTYQAITDPNKTTEGGPLFFFHSNGTLLQTFQKDKDLSAFWNLMGTTKKGNQTIVTYLEAKNYPFYIVQFHPERLAFSNSMSNQLFYARGELATTIALNFAMKSKESLHRYARAQLTNDIVNNFPMFASTRFSDYGVYLFNEWGQGSLRKDQINNEGFDLTSWVTMIFFVGLFLGASYFIFKKKQQPQTQQGENTEVYSPTHKNNNYVDFRQGKN